MWPFSNPSSTLKKPFTYPRLRPKGQFRVIEVLPPPLPAAWPLQPPTLRVKISSHDLDSDVAYETLSYCWGVSPGQLPDRRVIIETDDGCETAELFIFENLARALSSIQKNMPPGRKIFADGICINQQDQEEMDQQVKLMGDIYKRCRRVIVWLGQGNKASIDFFDTADQIGTDPSLLATLDMPPQTRASIYIAAADRYITASTAEQPQEHGLDPASLQLADQLGRMVGKHIESFPVAGYADVLQRPWFNRLWVIQEAALPPEGVFLCGNKQLGFHQFRGIYLFYGVYSKIWLNTRRKALPAREYRLRDDIFQKTAPFVRIFRERALFPGREPATLLELVKRFNVNATDTKIGATEPKDRIFALEGLSRDGKMLEAWRYEDSAAEAYSRFAAEAIQTEIDILLFAQRRLHTLQPPTHASASKLAPFPSWVPDWSLDPIRTPCGYTNGTDNKSLYAAGGGGLRRNQLPIVDYPTLRLHGILLDRIDRVGERQLQKEKDSITPRQLDQVSVKLFFDEIDTLMDEASAKKREGSREVMEEGEEGEEGEEEERFQAAVCLADASLTIRQLPDVASGKVAVTEAYSEVRRLSSFIALSRETRDTYMSLGRTYAKHRPQVPRWLWIFPPLVLAQFLVSGFSVLLAVGYMRLYVGFMHLKDWRRLLSPYSASDVEMVTRAGGSVAIQQNPATADYRLNMFQNMGRRLYVTQRGYIGLAPWTIQEGDYVAVFFGGSSPFIVRPDAVTREDTRNPKDRGDPNVNATPRDGIPFACTLVGETYCHGFMDGEALGQDYAGNTTTFSIS